MPPALPLLLSAALVAAASTAAIVVPPVKFTNRKENVSQMEKNMYTRIYIQGVSKRLLLFSLSRVSESRRAMPERRVPVRVEPGPMALYFSLEVYVAPQFLFVVVLRDAPAPPLPPAVAPLSLFYMIKI